jgi:hypothetical protein
MNISPRTWNLKGLLGLIFGFACLWSAWAQPIPIANAGFESNSITPGAFVVLDPQNWVRYDPSSIIDNAFNAVGVIRPSPGTEYFPGGAPEGNNAALVYLAGGQTAQVGLQQNLTATLQPSTRYRLSAQIGNIASGTSLPGSSGGPGVFYNLNGFPGYRLDLLAGGSVIAADTNSIGATIPEGEFRRATLIFDTGTANAQLGQALGVRVVNLKMPGTTNAPNIEVDFDDVSLNAGPIPVPASLAISLVGSQANILVSGTTGATYRVEYSGVLPAVNWATLTNVTLAASSYTALDMLVVTNSENRFYRAVLIE